MYNVECCLTELGKYCLISCFQSVNCTDYNINDILWLILVHQSTIYGKKTQ